MRGLPTCNIVIGRSVDRQAAFILQEFPRARIPRSFTRPRECQPIGERARFHRPGIDPDCTALAVQLDSLGLGLPGLNGPVSEALLFGIGGGIGAGVFQFIYEQEDFASFFVAGRASWEDPLSWLGNACKRLGLTYRVFESGARRKAAAALTAYLEGGRPVIAWVDSGLLSYRGMGDDCEGGGYHTVSVHHLGPGGALLGDLAPAPLAVPEADLANARARIRKHRNRLLQVCPGQIEGNLEGLVWAGLRACVDGQDKPRNRSFSIEAFRVWGQRLHGGSGKQAWSSAYPVGHRLLAALVAIARYVGCYENDGALHRDLMAQFLSEAGAAIGDPELGALASAYRGLAQSWRRLAESALPESCEPLANLRAGLYSARAAFLAGLPDASGRLRSAEARIDELDRQLKAGSQFPLSPVQITGLLEDLQVQVLAIYAAEKSALDELGRWLADSRDRLAINFR